MHGADVTVLVLNVVVHGEIAVARNSNSMLNNQAGIPIELTFIPSHLTIETVEGGRLYSYSNCNYESRVSTLRKLRETPLNEHATCVLVTCVVRICSIICVLLATYSAYANLVGDWHIFMKHFIVTSAYHFRFTPCLRPLLRQIIPYQDSLLLLPAHGLGSSTCGCWLPMALVSEDAVRQEARSS